MTASIDAGLNDCGKFYKESPKVKALRVIAHRKIMAIYEKYEYPGMPFESMTFSIEIINRELEQDIKDAEREHLTTAKAPESSAKTPERSTT